MKAGEKIFIIGKDPGIDSPMRKDIEHLVDGSMVRFVKHPENGELYFNVRDFLIPFNNPKYEKVVKSIFPKRLKHTDRIWMSVNAWKEIKKGMDEGKEDDVISGWKEQLLF